MLELLQFRHSPYNEKVRWALDLKRVPHRRRSLLPGPHMAAVKRHTGRTQTPTLIHDGGALDGSARILAWLEQRYPEPVLFPCDIGLRAAAEAIEARFDEDFTPRIRRVVLDALLREPWYFADVFGQGQPWLKRRLYALLVPLAAPLIRKGNAIVDAKSVEDGVAAGYEALDFVAEHASTTGYLCGRCFSVADLAAAATLAVLVRPARSPMSAPTPVGPISRDLLLKFAKHPAAEWVRGMYAAHRAAALDFDGPSP